MNCNSFSIHELDLQLWKDLVHMGLSPFVIYPYWKILREQNKDYSNQISSKPEETGTLRNIK